MATPIAVSETAGRPRSWPRILLTAGRVLLGAIFVYAAYAKFHFNGQWHLGDYGLFFAMAIDSYQMLPLWAAELLARTLPWLELGLGALLILGVGVRWAGLMISGLLLVFMGAMLRAYVLGLEINCGCFGNNEKLGVTTLLRDSSLLFLALGVTVGAFLVGKHRATAPR